MSSRSPEPALPATEPFRSADRVPVAGGMITFAEAGRREDEADSVVLAIHGVASNLMVWRSVARALAPASGVRIVAPDLRGRAESASLPGPYGIQAHVADMLALLEHLHIERPVLAGHSMGAYIAARLAAEHPERAAALVLVDGGVPLADLTEDCAAAVRTVVIGPALARRAITFMSTGAYLDFMRLHPALADAWNLDVEAYALHDLHGKAPSLRYVINVEAIETDSDEMLWDPVNRSAIERVQAPVHVLRAPRGSVDDNNPMIPRAALEAFAAEHPDAVVEQVEGVNHYTLLLGDSPGPARVAAAIEAATGSGQQAPARS
jgi:lipase